MSVHYVPRVGDIVRITAKIGVQQNGKLCADTSVYVPREGDICADTSVAGYSPAYFNSGILGALIAAGRVELVTPDGLVLAEVANERGRQDATWGEQNHPDGTGRPGSREFADYVRALCKANGPAEDNWRDILYEEVAEAFAETDPAKLRAELIQVAAVAVNWIGAIDRRTA